VFTGSELLYLAAMLAVPLVWRKVIARWKPWRLFGRLVRRG